MCMRHCMLIELYILIEADDRHIADLCVYISAAHLSRCVFIPVMNHQTPAPSLRNGGSSLNLHWVDGRDARHASVLSVPRVLECMAGTCCSTRDYTGAHTRYWIRAHALWLVWDYYTVLRCFNSVSKVPHFLVWTCLHVYASGYSQVTRFVLSFT
jgi:hypothetical protein